MQLQQIVSYLPCQIFLFPISFMIYIFNYFSWLQEELIKDGGFQ